MWKTFMGPSFQLEVPSNWLVMSSPQFQAIFLAPPREDATQSSLMISIKRVEKGVTAQDVAAEALKGQQEAYAEFEVLNEIDFVEEDSQGVLRTYQWYDESQDLRLQQTQVVYVVGQTMYTLTATRQADISYGEDVDNIFSYMIESFAGIDVPIPAEETES